MYADAMEECVYSQGFKDDDVDGGTGKARCLLSCIFEEMNFVRA